jgi:hypothetical protein
MRYRLFTLGAAVALVVGAGSGAGAGRASGEPAAGQPACINFISLGPMAAAAGRSGLRSIGGLAYTLRGQDRPAGRAGVWAGPVPAWSRPVGTKRTAEYTVTVTGTTIGGRPAGGRNDDVFLVNADDPALSTSVTGFADGVAKFRVPAGNYWALGDFTKLLPKQDSWDEYLDVLPEFPVSQNTTVHVAAEAATSRIGVVVPRPVTEQYLTFQLIRSGASGPPVSLGWMLANAGPKAPVPELYINPVSVRPPAGELTTVTNEQLGSAAFPSSSRYLYDLAYQSTGTTPSHRYMVNPYALATVHMHYYAAAESAGVSGTFPAFPVSNVCSLGGAIFGDMAFPASQTVYLTANRALTWQTQYIQNAALDYSGGQNGPFQAYLPGEQQTQDFGAYPLHPAPDVRLSDLPAQPPVQVSAGRAGNTLRLAMTAFSDSTPGHTGQGTFPPVTAAASYQIDQNGTKIAGGAVPGFTGPFAATATLRPAPSVIQFSLNTAESAKLNPLSTASHTVWTWRSARVSGATLPPGWTCQPGQIADRACNVQPLMTLRYSVVGLGLDGAAAPGQQVVNVLVGHLQLARAAKITAARVSVSFDHGKTWRAARVTGSDGSYAAVFRAPPGTQVTLRTSASDADGGAITETITNAYQTAP